jgi:hypothetical protein
VNHYDQFYALHIFEKATTRADVWLYIVAVLAFIVIGVTA